MSKREILGGKNQTQNSILCSTTTSTDWQHVCKLSFIENQIKICEAIQSPIELQYWYAMLGSHLASHGTEKRIRFLLDDLLGPTHSFVDISKVTDRTILVSFQNQKPEATSKLSHRILGYIQA